jgi:hypothetical protein
MTYSNGVPNKRARCRQPSRRRAAGAASHAAYFILGFPFGSGKLMLMNCGRTRGPVRTATVIQAPAPGTNDGSGGMLSGLVTAVRAGRCPALGFVPFVEAFERHHDLVRLHPTAAFKIDKRERND